MILLPDLSQTNFISFEVSLAAEINSDARSAFAGKERHLRGFDFESFANEHYFLSLDVEIREKLLVKVKMEYTSLFSDGIFDPKDAERLTAATIQKRIQPASGKEHVVYVKCGFRVDVEELPEGGIVRRGLGVCAQFHEDELRLAGAQ